MADDGIGSDLFPRTESCRIGYQRFVILLPIVEPANVVLPGGFMQPLRLSFQLDHLHVTENGNESWLLAEPLVGLDILEFAVQDVRARGHVGLITVGGTWVRAERVPEAERRNWRGPHSCKVSSRKPPPCVTLR